MSFRCALCIALLAVGLAGLSAVSRPDQADPRRRSLETLRYALREAKEWKKVHAAEALIWTGYPQGVKEIFTSELASAGPGYSIGVWRVLARLEPKGTPNYKIYLDKIRRVATGPDGDERIGALETLGKLGYAGRDAETIEAAKGTTGLLPIVARWVLANSGKPEDETRLVELLDMKEPLERGVVGYALRWLPKLRTSTRSKLKATIGKEPQDSVGRVYLVAALYVHASQKEDRQWARQELLKYITTGKEEEKYEAASVLGRWGERKDIPKLLPLLDDPDFDVQIGGAYAILTIDRRFPRHTGVWRDDTFEDFAAGTLGSAGANLYVSRKGWLQTIHHWDYNADGYIDLVFNSTHDTAFQLPATIYAGSRNGLSSQPVTKLPSNGGQFATTGDLNGDGYTDIVLVNGHNGIHQETGLFIYWGGKEGYSVKRRSVLCDDRQIVAAVTFRLPKASSDGLVMAFSGMQAPILIAAYSQYPQAVELPIREVTSLAVDGSYLFAVSKGSVRRFKVDEYGHVLEDRALPGEEVSRVLIRDLNGDGRSDLICLRGEKNALWLKDGNPDEAPRELPVSASVALAVGDFNKDGKPDIAAASAKTVVVCTATGAGFRRAIELPIGWVTALAIGDGNGDGWPDLAVTRGRDEDSYEAESWVFWGGARGFSSSRKSAVRTEGANDVLCADFTRDGIDDLLFVNRVRGRTAGDVPVMIYWGGPGGKYGVQRRTLLPTIGGYASIGADLNDDGYIDLVEFCGYDDDPYNDRGSMIFWGSKNGLNLKSPSFIPTKNALFGTIADLNHDGYLDILASEFHVSDTRQGDLKILWGGAEGYTRMRTTSLKFPGLKDPRGTLIADLNRDGWLDIVVADIMQTACVIYWGHPTGYNMERVTLLPAVGPCVVQTADLNRDGWLDLVIGGFWNPITKTQRVPSYVYMGGPEGFDPSRRYELETFGAHHCSIADLNKDGYFDIVFSNYLGDRVRSLDCYIYWGGKDGYRQQRRTGLFNDSAAGMLVGDFNEDGWQDICFSNHTRNGDHNARSRIYWGSPTGFQKKKVTFLPTIGPHFMAPVDMGNIATRQFVETFTSRVYYAPAPNHLAQLRWKAVMSPRGGSLRFQIRSAESREALARATWQGPNGPNTYFTRSGASLTKLFIKGPYYQYRVFFDMTNAGSAPRIDWVEVRFTR